MVNNKKIILENIDENWFNFSSSKKRDRVYLFLKRKIDIILGLIGFIIFIIFLPFVALLIKIESRGNIIYRQERFGKDRKVFLLYKFRTMYESKDNSEKTWREKDDNNITRIGKILRRSHLDELPQAINILRGDISFVGPRPEWTELAKKFEQEIPFYKQRYLLNPGLIGWAQINYPASRSIEEAKEKFEYDLYYIKNQSLFLDLEIILKMVRLFFL
jgi:lipopolysaccharide/colanic/teichoic acid biosynthesis glycosyltransferase